MGFKFLILGYFGGEKILASNLLGRALNSSSGFFGYSKLMSPFFMLFHLMLSEIFLWLRNSAWDFWRDKFWSRDLFGFCLKPKGIFWVLIFAPIQTSLSLEMQGTPVG